MTDFNSDEYDVYYKDQADDNNVIMPETINKYMELLTNTLLPDVDYNNVKILDVGSRAFETWDYFLTNHQNKIIGIDVGKEGLEYCAKQGKTGMMELDAHKMHEFFEKEQFDIIIALHSLEHMYDLPMVLNNCAEVLKPNGYLFFALPMPSYNWKRGHWYDVPNNEAMLKMCQAAGFTTTLYHELIGDLRYRPEQEMVGLVQKN